MTNMKGTNLLLAVLITWITHLLDIEALSDQPLLLLISFDGFRHDYLQKVRESGRKTPNFDRLRPNGVEAEHVKNAFMTVTFPNHYTIVTGHYEESHGVISNIMYDPILNATYSEGDSEMSVWFNNGTENLGAEPIWITNEKASSTSQTTLTPRRSGVMFWIGSEVEIHGTRPSHWMHYDKDFPNISRIDNIIKWFSDPMEPINLGLLYFSEPDHLGHIVGPNSEYILELIIDLDNLIGYLIGELEKHDLFDRMNIIITSDHGMTQVKKDNIIVLNEYIDPSYYVMYGYSPAKNIIPLEGKQEEVYTALRNIPHLHTYYKEDLPREYHYTYNRRIQPIVIFADEGYDIVQHASEAADYRWVYGEHGYSNTLPSMHPFFIAHGPAFKKGYKSPPLNIVDIYPLMCHILNIEPYPNNGSLSDIQHILNVDTDRGALFFNMTIWTFLLTVGSAAFISGIFCISAFRTYRIMLRRRHRGRPLVVMAELPHHVPNGNSASSPLLYDDQEDEEEIP